MALLQQVFNNSGGVAIAETINGDVNISTSIGVTTEPEPICFQVDIPEINFTGRAHELRLLKDAMEESLNLDNPRTHTVIVVGLGGIGKTQLVRQFIHQNRTSYKNIIWIDSEKFESIKEAYQILAVDRLNISTTNADGGKKDFKSIVQHVLNKLTTAKTLFVYDNVDEIEIMKFVLTKQTLGGKLHVIITSRIQEWDDDLHIIKLNVWGSDDAISYVSTTLKDPGDLIDDKMSLVQTLQYFPLALRQATAHINYQRKYRHFQICDYVNKYGKQETLDSKFFQKNACSIYEKTTYTTWKITIDAIERDAAIGQLAVRILRIIAYFDPDHINRDIFIHLANKSENPPITNAKIDYEENVRSAVRLLVNYSMVDSLQQQSILSVHRLVQQVIKIELENTSDKGKEILRDGLMLISKLIEVENLRENIDHGIAVFQSALIFYELIEEFRTIPNTILFNLNYYGKYNRAKAFGVGVLQTLTNILGDDHIETLNTKQNIGSSYTELGKHSEALEIYQEVLNKQNSFVGEDHRDTLTTKHNIAHSFGGLGKHFEALELYKEVLETKKKILGEYHPDTLITKHNIGISYGELGKNTEALEIYNEVLEKLKNILGEDHPFTLKIKGNIAYSYSKLGKHSEALEVFQGVLDKENNILGVDHPHTLLIKYQVAYSYGELEKHSEALEIYKEVLVKRTNILGEDHPHTLTTKHNIARSYSRLGKHAEALEIFQEVLLKLNNILGDDHPNTLVTKHDIANSYMQLGKHSHALEIYEEVHEKQKNILGEDHPDTLRDKHKIAASYSQLGKHTVALEIYRDIRVKRKNILGEVHPDTLNTESMLATSYYQLGKHSEALEIYKEVFEKRKNILGEDHPHTLRTKHNIAASYCRLGKHSEALKAYKEVFDKQNNILGEEHPLTLLIKHQIAHSYGELGKHAEALQIYKEVLVSRKNILGEDHPCTLTTEHNIAYSYGELGKHSEALEIYQKVLDKQKNILGEDHPDTLLTKQIIDKVQIRENKFGLYFRNLFSNLL